MIRVSFIGQCIELACNGVPCDRRVETGCIEGRKPGAKPCKLAWRKLLNSLFDFFSGCHVTDISTSLAEEKTGSLIGTAHGGAGFPN